MCTFIAFAIRVVQRLSRTLIQLNVATRAHHGIADAPWLELMSPTVDKPRYVAHLLKVYGFEAPLESAFRYTPGLTALIGLRARVRTGLLAQDLMRLGMAASQIAQLPQRFVTFGSAAEALGWMYVVERTALLHGNLRRHLAHRLPETGLATSYLSAYDDQIGMRWSELGCAFDTIAPAPSMVRQIIRAAHQAFVAMHVWFTDAVVSPVKQAMAT